MAQVGTMTPVSAPTAATQSMPFIPGYGYGLAVATGDVGNRYIAGERYADAEALRERQMDVNEAAQKASGEYYGAVSSTIRNNEKRSNAQYESTGIAHDVMGALDGSRAPGTNMLPKNPELPYVPPPANGAAPIAANSPAASGYGAGGSGVAPLDVAKADTAIASSQNARKDPSEITNADIQTLGTYKDVAAGVKAPVVPNVPNGGGNTAVARTVSGFRGNIQGGQQGGGKDAQTMGNMGGPDTAAAQLAMREGKTAVTPTEGNGFIQKGKELNEGADQIQARLKDALKVIEQKYSGDPTYASYLKANLVASVDPQVAAMRDNASKMQNQGELANHMQVGAQLGQRITAVIQNGGTLDSKFIEQNKHLMNYLGVHESDVHLFDGMHLSNGRHPGDDRLNAGFVVNAGGYIIPYKALWEASNFALPYAQRAQAWTDMTNMYKDQMKAKAELTTAYNMSPTAIIDYAAQKTRETVVRNSEMTRVAGHAESVLQYGGTINLPGAGGKSESVKIPAMPPGKKLDDLIAMTFNNDPTLDGNIKRVIKNVLLPARQEKDTTATLLPLYSHWGKTQVSAPDNSNTIRFREELKAKSKEELEVMKTDYRDLLMKAPEDRTPQENERLKNYVSSVKLQ